MENLKELDKAAMGRGIVQVNNDIISISAKLDKSISIPLMLCVTCTYLKGVKKSKLGVRLYYFSF